MARTAKYDREPTEPQIVDTARKGIVVKLVGETGSYVVQGEVLTEKGREWVELIGGPPGHKQFRAVRPWAVRWPKQPKGTT